MVRIIAQILAGLMLFFGVVTLFAKSYFDYRAKRIKSGIVYTLFGLAALFFSLMAFAYALSGF
jgi:intracellular septation protein A